MQLEEKIKEDVKDLIRIAVEDGIAANKLSISGLSLINIISSSDFVNKFI